MLALVTALDISKMKAPLLYRVIRYASDIPI